MPWDKQFDKRAALDQALQAFWARGFEATSMQVLVQRMGINRGSIYATYGDKRSLFLAALRSYDESRRALLASLEERFAPREAIRHVFQAFTGDVAEGGGNRGCFLANTALELAAHDTEIRAIVAEAQVDIENFFARIIRKGKASAEISSAVRAEETARGLLASLLGVLVLVRSRPDAAVLSSVVEDAMRRLT